MSLFQKDRSVTAATDLRFVYGPNAAKKIARRFGVAVVTAKLWLAGRTPAAREQEIARTLLAECSRLETIIADTRRRWEGVVGDELVETGGALARREADCDGSPSRGVGGKMSQ